MALMYPPKRSEESEYMQVCINAKVILIVKN